MFCSFVHLITCLDAFVFSRTIGRKKLNRTIWYGDTWCFWPFSFLHLFVYLNFDRWFRQTLAFSTICNFLEKLPKIQKVLMLWIGFLFCHCIYVLNMARDGNIDKCINNIVVNGTTLNLVVDFNHNIIITHDCFCCLPLFSLIFLRSRCNLFDGLSILLSPRTHPRHQSLHLFHRVMIFKMLFTSFLLNSIHTQCVQYLIKIINYVHKHIIYVNQIYVIGFLSAY